MNRSAEFYNLESQLRHRKLGLVVFETIIVTVILAFAFTGNVLVCWTLYRRRQSSLQRVANYYVAALAVSDIFFACFVFPFVLGVSATGSWPFNDTSCQFQGYMSMWMTYASILTITLTALNRFVKVVKPYLYRKFYTPRKTVTSIVAVWVLSCVGALPHLLLGNKYVFHPGKMVCLFDLDKVSLTYTIIMASVYFGIPLTVMVACYFMIFWVVRQYNDVFSKATDTTNTNRSTFNRADINVTKVLFAVLIAFFLCYTQIAVIDMIETLHKQFSQPRQVYLLYTVMAGLASCLNPVIYCVMNPTFRRQILNFLRCCKSHEEDDT